MVRPQTQRRPAVYIGQTFELPATVIAQSDRGAVTVLAAFASPEMSLRRHVETFVQPWLVAHCPWVFADRRLLLGVVEEIESEAQCNFVQTLNDLLGGSWNPANHPWESRRDSMLDVFGKVQGYTMKPALQIHRTDARLLVEALSGRWSYEQDRATSAPSGITWRMLFLAAPTASTQISQRLDRR